MSMLRLFSIVLLVLLALICTLPSALAQDSSAQSTPSTTARAFNLDELQHFNATSDHMAINATDKMDHTCLKIRAFIFETNDDQVPRFVRETTCLPTNKAYARKAAGAGQQPVFQLVSK
jgi:hypothetical protein